jgi:hypothetical protein
MYRQKENRRENNKYGGSVLGFYSRYVYPFSKVYAINFMSPGIHIHRANCDTGPLTAFTSENINVKVEFQA